MEPPREKTEMERYTLQFQWLFIVVAGLGLSACVSGTEIFVPQNLTQLEPTHARIVVTRENQLAGMTTPIYIMDIGDEAESNGSISVRVGNWIEEPGLNLWYIPDLKNAFTPGGFMFLPSPNITFAESGLRLDDLLKGNLNAVIYVDRLSCDPRKLNSLSCSDGRSNCMEDWAQELTQRQGTILDRGAVIADNAEIRPIRVLGKISSGESLVWDRKPGLMRLGALWGSDDRSEDIVELTPGNIEVEAGKIYYLHYEISLSDRSEHGDRWSITQVE
jgi:hypothetical protein